MFSHPALLLGATDTHKQHIYFGIIDLPDYLLIFFLC